MVRSDVRREDDHFVQIVESEAVLAQPAIGQSPVMKSGEKETAIRRKRVNDSTAARDRIIRLRAHAVVERVGQGRFDERATERRRKAREEARAKQSTKPCHSDQCQLRLSVPRPIRRGTPVAS